VFLAIRGLLLLFGMYRGGSSTGLFEKLGFLRIWLGPGVARQERSQFRTLCPVWRARCPVMMANQPMDIDWTERAASRLNADPSAESQGRLKNVELSFE